MNKKYIVRLSTEERAELENLRKKERTQPYRRTHAEILLLADQSPDGPAWKDEQIAEAAGVHKCTVENVRQRLVEQGLEAALNRKKRETPPVNRRQGGPHHRLGLYGGAGRPCPLDPVIVGGKAGGVESV
jgi:hypothetical protein